MNGYTPDDPHAATSAPLRPESLFFCARASRNDAYSCSVVLGTREQIQFPLVRETGYSNNVRDGILTSWCFGIDGQIKIFGPQRTGLMIKDICAYDPMTWYAVKLTFDYKIGVYQCEVRDASSLFEPGKSEEHEEAEEQKFDEIIEDGAKGVRPSHASTDVPQYSDTTIQSIHLAGNNGNNKQSNIAKDCTNGCAQACNTRQTTHEVLDVATCEAAFDTLPVKGWGAVSFWDRSLKGADTMFLFNHSSNVQSWLSGIKFSTRNSLAENDPKNVTASEGSTCGVRGCPGGHASATAEAGEDGAGAAGVHKYTSPVVVGRHGRTREELNEELVNGWTSNTHPSSRAA
jgi:hypothetical protein